MAKIKKPEPKVVELVRVEAITLRGREVVLNDAVAIVKDHLYENGFDAIFKYAWVDEAQPADIYEITVVGGVGYDPRRFYAGLKQAENKTVCEWRTFGPERIIPLDQSRFREVTT